MILLFSASILVQILAVLHVIRTGREQIWIWVIVLFNMLGVCAYFAFEIMPEMFGPNSPRANQAKAKAVDSPSVRLKRAEAALVEVETTANHKDVADAMYDMGAFEGAALHYRKALDCLRGPDARIEKRLAEALFENGQATEALALVESQIAPSPGGEADRLTLLRARILDHLGRGDEAVDLYRDVTTRLPGVEARCRFAALLLQRGERDEAQSVLEEVSRTLDKSAAAKAGEDAEMHRWAMQQLADLRAG
jgi:hypothetical protein